MDLCRVFLPEYFQFFWGVKFSIYLNRRVFVMTSFGNTFFFIWENFIKASICNKI